MRWVHIFDKPHGHFAVPTVSKSLQHSMAPRQQNLQSSSSSKSSSSSSSTTLGERSNLNNHQEQQLTQRTKRQRAPPGRRVISTTRTTTIPVHHTHQSPSTTSHNLIPEQIPSSASSSSSYLQDQLTSRKRFRTQRGPQPTLSPIVTRQAGALLSTTSASSVSTEKRSSLRHKTSLPTTVSEFPSRTSLRRKRLYSGGLSSTSLQGTSTTISPPAVSSNRKKQKCLPEINYQPNDPQTNEMTNRDIEAHASSSSSSSSSSGQIVDPHGVQSNDTGEVRRFTEKRETKKVNKKALSDEGNIKPDDGDLSPVNSAISALEGILAAAFHATPSTKQTGRTKTKTEHNRKEKEKNDECYNDEEIESQHREDHSNDDEQTVEDKLNNESNNESNNDEDAGVSRRQLVALSSLFKSVVASGDDRFPCFDRRFGGGSKWSSKVSGLESHDPNRQCTILTELCEWLSYANEDSIGGFPIERAVRALIDILADRRTTTAKSQPKRGVFGRGERGRRVHHNERTDGDGDWVDLPPTLFGLEEGNESNGEQSASKNQTKSTKDEQQYEKKNEEENVIPNTQDVVLRHQGLNDNIRGNNSTAMSESRIPKAVEVFRQLLEQRHNAAMEHHDDEDEPDEIEEHHTVNQGESMSVDMTMQDDDEEEEGAYDDEDGDHELVTMVENTMIENGPSILMYENTFELVTRKVTAANCLHMLMDIAPQSARIVANGDGIKVLCQQLQQIEYIDLAERIVLVLQQLASETPGRLLEQGGLEAMLEFVEFFPIAVQRTIIQASCALLGHIQSKADYESLIKKSLPQIGSLLLREDEQILQTVCQSLHRLVDFVARENSTSSGFARESFDDMTNHGIVRNLMSLMKRAVLTSQGGNGEPPLVRAYLFSLESLYILSVFVFYSNGASEQLLDLSIFGVLTDLFGLQGVPGQDSLLTLRILGLVTSIFPIVLFEVSPHHDSNLTSGCSSWLTHQIVHVDRQRAEIFRSREDELRILCQDFNRSLLRSLRLPTGGETLRLSLTYFLSLTLLLRHLSFPQLFIESNLINGFLDSLDVVSLASFLYSVLAASIKPITENTNNSISNTMMIFQDYPNDHRTSLTTTFASLLIISNIIEFQPNRFIQLWYRYGILDIVKHLSNIQLLSKNSGHNNNPFNIQLQLMIKHESNDWNLIVTSMLFNTQIESSTLMNISIVIRWASCYLGCSLLSSLINKFPCIKNQDTLNILTTTSKVVSLPALSTALLEAARNSTNATEEAAQQALRSFRCLLVRNASDNSEGISSFELHDSGLIDALCMYLFGGHVQSPSSGTAKCRAMMNSFTQQKSSSIYEKRLMIFIKELCGLPSTISELSQPITGCLGSPADLRPLLLLSRLCVGCMEQLENLSFRLHTIVSGVPHQSFSSTGASSNKQISSGGCLPRHLHTDQQLHYSVLTIARQQFGNDVATSIDGKRFIRRLESSIRRQHHNSDLADNGSLSGVALTQGTHHHLEKCLMFKPQSLFQCLNREIKLFACCAVGPITCCHISFPSNLQIKEKAESSANVFAPNSPSVESVNEFIKIEEIETFDAEFYKRLKSIKKNLSSSLNDKSTPCLPGFSNVFIADPRLADDLVLLASQASSEQKTTFLLQLSVNMRTTGSLLEQSLSGVVERQLAIIEEKRKLKRTKAQGKSEKQEGVEGANNLKSTSQTDIAHSIPDDEVLLDDNSHSDLLDHVNHSDNRRDSKRALSSTLSSSQKDSTVLESTSPQHLFISINGYTIPSHMTVCEALCRYSNVLTVDRASINNSLHQNKSGPLRTAGIPNDVNQFDILDQQQDDEDSALSHSQSPSSSSTGDLEAVASPSDTTSDLSGVWLAVDSSRRLIISSRSEERLLAVEIKDSRSKHRCSSMTLTEQSLGMTNQPSFSSGVKNCGLKQMKISPLWGIDHHLRVGIGNKEPIFETMKTILEQYEQVKNYFIREKKLDAQINIEEIYCNDSTKVPPTNKSIQKGPELKSSGKKRRSSRTGNECKVEENDSEKLDEKLDDIEDVSLKRSIIVMEFPVGTEQLDDHIAILPNGDRLICLTSLLCYLQVKRSCQILGFSKAVVDGYLGGVKTEVGEKIKDCKNNETLSVSKCNEDDKNQFDHFEDQIPPFAKSWSVTTAKIVEVIDPVELSQRLRDLLQFFDLSLFNSPLVCNSFKSKFSHLSLYQSMIQETKDQSEIKNERNIEFSFDQRKVEPFVGFIKSGDLGISLGTSVLSIVQEQMKYLRGYQSWIRQDLILDAATYPVFKNEENGNENENLTEDKIEDDDDEGDEVCENEESEFVNENDDDDEDEDEYIDMNEDDEGLDIEEVLQLKRRKIRNEHNSYKPTNIQQLRTLQYEDRDEGELNSDIFEESEDLAQVLQLVILLSRLIQFCVGSNNCLATKSSKQFLIDDPENGPYHTSRLYFPSYSQIRAGSTSPLLAIKASRQLADPIVIASAKIPRWVSALPSIAPLLLPFDVRKTILKSSCGSFVGLVSFKERIREIAEAIGALHSSSNGSYRNLRFSSSRPSGLIKTDPLLDKGRLTYDTPDDLNEDFDNSIKTDPIILALAKEILGADDINKRKQLERLSDLEQALSPQRAKIRLNRNQALLSAAKVLDYFHLHNTTSAIPALMEIEYFDEEGVGSGPTLEFYSEVLDRLYAFDEPLLFRKEKSEGCLFPQPYSSNPLMIPPHLLRRPINGRLIPVTASAVIQPNPPNESQPSTTTERSRSFSSSSPGLRMESSSAINNDSINNDSIENPTHDNEKESSTRKRPIEESLFLHFKLLGQLFAKAVLDGRLIDLPLHPVFWSFVTSPVSQWSALATEPALASVDPTLYRHLNQLRQIKESGEKLEQLSISFVLPGSSPEIQMQPNGKQILIDEENLESFIRNVCEWTLWKGIRLQIWAFRFGVATLMPLSGLSLFTSMELTNALAGGVSATEKDEFWSLEHLRKTVTADHGFTSSSPTFIYFLEVVNELTPVQRRLFLKFCTGTTVLPHGGFAALKPSMKVVRKETPTGKPSSYADDTLPSVMACSNYIKLPLYSSKAKLKEKLLLALSEGQGAFTLS